MNMPPWIDAVRDTAWEWLQSVRHPSVPGGYRWCRHGGLLEPTSRSGLGSSALALKTVCQLDRLGDISTRDLAAWVRYIRSFQVCWPPSRIGFFEDPSVLGPLDAKMNGGYKDQQTRRAETRQACAALLCAGCKPRFPVCRVPYSAKAVHRYVTRLAWEEDPWGAGSQTSHLVFFYHLNAMVTGLQYQGTRLIPAVLSELDRLRDQDTGAWFRGTPSVSQRINGAMKVLTAYDLLKRRLPSADRLVDLCLDHISEGNACHNLDVVYVLHECRKWTSHREREVVRFAEQKLDIIRQHVKSDGGFSFYPDRAAVSYYGNVRVSNGLPESDLQGTHLYIWAITLISDLLGFRDELGWRLPVT